MPLSIRHYNLGLQSPITMREQTNNQESLNEAITHLETKYLRALSNDEEFSALKSLQSEINDLKKRLPGDGTMIISDEMNISPGKA